ncbi:MAG: helix-turn-helix transcriptional regulator [bacterium]|nr:helix-turn-helix transcriptional regulator [bacterium]
MAQDRAFAIAGVRQRMGTLRVSPTELARKAGIDPGTVRDFLAGNRWPQMSKLAAIEDALGWATGSIDLLANGADGDSILTRLDDAPVTGSRKGVLLNLPDAATEGMSELDVREATADAEATFLRRIAEIKARRAKETTDGR